MFLILWKSAQKFFLVRLLFVPRKATVSSINLLPHGVAARADDNKGRACRENVTQANIFCSLLVSEEGQRLTEKLIKLLSKCMPDVAYRVYILVRLENLEYIN